MSKSAGEQLERLEKIMSMLRAENGCPWDREQDLLSLRPYLIEEAYEVLEEMDRASSGEDWRALCEELGDLLFQIVFHAQIARERGQFVLADVCEAIGNKIERRHPHVFAGKAVRSAHEVMENWATLKAQERRQKTGKPGSVLDGVPKDAPSLLRAERLTEKASRIGFDWPDLAGVRRKLDEELSELDAAIASSDRGHIEHELGDVLFSLVNLARFVKTPPEDALRMAIGRFISRFHGVETGLAEANVPFGKASLEQMESLWQKAKAKEALVPSPRTLPLGNVLGVRIGVADLASQKRFWDELSSELGWNISPLPGSVRYTIGNLTLTFHQATRGQQGIELWLQAPSRKSLDTLREKLTSLDVSSSLERMEDRERPLAWSVRFTDPSGLRCVYVF